MSCTNVTLNCCNDVKEGKTLWFKFKCKAALLRVESEILRDMPCLLLLIASWSVALGVLEAETGSEVCPEDGGGSGQPEPACKAWRRGCWWWPAPRGAPVWSIGIGLEYQSIGFHTLQLKIVMPHLQSLLLWWFFRALHFAIKITFPNYFEV